VSRPRVLLVITLAETGGAQTYVVSLVPALLGELDVAVVAHGHGFRRDAVVDEARCSSGNRHRWSREARPQALGRRWFLTGS
jgi:hypothetical protein